MNNKKAIKSGIWYTFSNFIVKSIVFLTTPIFARLLTKSEYGLFDNYASVLAIMYIIVTLNMDSTLISAKHDFEDSLDEYILSVMMLGVFSSFLWIVVVNLFYSVIYSVLGINRVYMNIMMIYILFCSVINLFQARERYYFEYKKTVLSSLFISLGTVTVSIVLIVNMPDRLMGRVLGSAVPTVMGGILLMTYLVIKGRRIRLIYWKYALPICVPYIPHLLSLNVLGSMDRVMITRWNGPDNNALYSVAYTCSSIVTVLMISMNNAYAPWMGENLNLMKYDDIRRFSKGYIGAFAFLVVGIMAISPEILLLLGGDKYMEAQYAIPPIMMGCVCQFVYILFVNVEQYKKKTIGMAIASFVAAFVNFILNCLMIPKYGYIAAAFTTLIGYICLLVIHMYLVYRLEFSDVYDYKMIYHTMVIMLCVTACMFLLYSYYLVRYAFIMVYLIACIYMIKKHGKNILEVIKNYKS